MRGDNKLPSQIYYSPRGLLRSSKLRILSAISWLIDDNADYDDDDDDDDDDYDDDGFDFNFVRFIWTHWQIGHMQIMSELLH